MSFASALVDKAESVAGYLLTMVHMNTLAALLIIVSTEKSKKPRYLPQGLTECFDRF